MYMHVYSFNKIARQLHNSERFVRFSFPLPFSSTSNYPEGQGNVINGSCFLELSASSCKWKHGTHHEVVKPMVTLTPIVDLEAVQNTISASMMQIPCPCPSHNKRIPRSRIETKK